MKEVSGTPGGRRSCDGRDRDGEVSKVKGLKNVLRVTKTFAKTSVLKQIDKIKGIGKTIKNIPQAVKRLPATVKTLSGNVVK